MLNLAPSELDVNLYKDENQIYTIGLSHSSKPDTEVLLEVKFDRFHTTEYINKNQTEKFYYQTEALKQVSEDYLETRGLSVSGPHVSENLERISENNAALNELFGPENAKIFAEIYQNPKIFKEITEDVGQIFENDSYLCNSLENYELSEKAQETLLSSIPCTCLNHNDPGYLPDNDVPSVITPNYDCYGEEATHDYAESIRQSLSDEIVGYYEMSEDEGIDAVLDDITRSIYRTSDAQVFAGLSFSGPDDHVFETYTDDALTVVSSNGLGLPENTPERSDEILDDNRRVLGDWLDRKMNPEENRCLDLECQLLFSHEDDSLQITYSSSAGENKLDSINSAESQGTIFYDRNEIAQILREIKNTLDDCLELQKTKEESQNLTLSQTQEETKSRGVRI